MPSSHPDGLKVPIIIAVLLTGMLVAAEIIYDPGLETEYNDDFYDHGSPNDFFPDFNTSHNVYIVDIFPEIENESLSSGITYALSSLQGLVNREQASVLLDYEGGLHHAEHMEYWDFFFGNYTDVYDLNISIISYTEFFDTFIGYATGTVVFDTDNEHTINVATTLAGLNNWISTDRETAKWFKDRYGLEVREDLHTGWDGSRADIYEKAFDRYYKDCNQKILFSSVPSEWGTDYLVACRGFVYCLNPGPFTTPAEKALAKKIMRETPADIPILGWFEQPTGVEENYMLQLASSSGKIFLGGFRFPNKSFFTAYQPVNNLSNPVNSGYTNTDNDYPSSDPEPGSVPPPDIGNKVYIAFAVTDGDNLGFTTRKMRKEMWKSEVRGTVPISWSINPLLAEVLPPLLDYYYSTTTNNDTFICGPSGSGYFNPGYCSGEQLDLWLERTSYGMEELDLRQIWLLNSFTTYETHYSEETLDDYVRSLAPDGIMLDYGDVPEGRKIWMQGTTVKGDEEQNGDNASAGSRNIAAPVIRSMHIWGDVPNYMGKLLVECDGTPSDEPIFAFSPVMSADLDLETIPDVIHQLEEEASSLDRDFEIVSIDDLFYLMERYFIQKATEVQDNIGPLDRLLGPSLVDNMESEYDSMVSIPESRGDTDGSRHTTAYHAYQSIEYYHQAEDRTALVLSLMLITIICLGAALVLWYQEIRHKRVPPEKTASDIRRSGDHEKSMSENIERSGSGKSLQDTGQDQTQDLFRDLKGILVKLRKSTGETFGKTIGKTMRNTQLQLHFLLLFTTFLLFYSASLRILHTNFWNYSFFGLAILLMYLIPRIFSKLDGSGSDMAGKIVVWARERSFQVQSIVLVISCILLPFHTAAYILIPFTCVRIIARTGQRFDHHLITALIAVILLSFSLTPLLIDFPFLPIGIILIWFLLLSYIFTISITSSTELSQTDAQTSVGVQTTHSIPLKNENGPLKAERETVSSHQTLSAILLSMLIIIQDMPFNRYLSIASGYRSGFLTLASVIIPPLSMITGYCLFRILTARNQTRDALPIVVGTCIPVSILLYSLPSIIDGRIVVLILLWIFGTAVVTAILLSWKTESTDGSPIYRRNHPDDTQFIRTLFSYLILGLLLATLPPITYSVYIIPLPTFFSYILYSLPHTIIILSCLVLLHIIRHDHKCKHIISS